MRLIGERNWLSGTVFAALTTMAALPVFIAAATTAHLLRLSWSPRPGLRSNLQARAAALVTLAVLMLLSCHTKSEQTGTGNGGAVTISAEEHCVDAWLTQRQLDAFGAPEGTAYAGGTPLFEESTGKGKSRVEYVYSKHPAARDACAAETGAR